MTKKVITEDSIQYVKKIDSESIHAIISDIPYGISYDKWDVLHNNTNSALGGSSEGQKKGGSLFKHRGKPLNGWSEADKNISKEYQEWCAGWAKDWLRVLKPGASCFIFAGRRYAHRAITALEDEGFIFKDMLAWEKEKAPHRAQRLSAIYGRREDQENTELWEGWRVANLRPIFEPILWFQKPYPTGTTLADNVIKYGVGGWNEKALEKYNIHAEGMKTQSNVLKISKDEEDSQGYHPTQKPLNLMRLLIELVTKEDQTVLDPFMGSGTTIIAAHELNRNYIGIDISDEYTEEAKKRIENVNEKKTNN